MKSSSYQPRLLRASSRSSRMNRFTASAPAEPSVYRISAFYEPKLRRSDPTRTLLRSLGGDSVAGRSINRTALRAWGGAAAVRRLRPSRLVIAGQSIRPRRQRTALPETAGFPREAFPQATRFRAARQEPSPYQPFLLRASSRPSRPSRIIQNLYSQESPG